MLIMKSESSLSNNKLYNKVAMIIGASSGIGKEIVNLFFNEGAYVIVISRNISNRFISYLEKEVQLSENY